MAEILPLEDAFGPALDLLEAGEVVAIPTETVYGLAADATNGEAVARIFEVKRRPHFNPLIVHVSGAEMASRIALFDRASMMLAGGYWPGPLTLVLPKRPACRICPLATAGLATAAVRLPRHPVARALLEAAGRPIAAPSANPSGRLSPVCAEHVEALLGGRVDWILDGGPTEEGLESAVVDLSGGRPALLRHGTLSFERLRQALPDLHMPAATATAQPRSPGMLRQHYAPRKPLRLGVSAPQPGEALLAFGPPPLPDGFAWAYNLSESGDPAEAARNLFTMLHALDAREEITAIAAMPLPESGLGYAVNDRLRRAACLEKKD